MLGYILRRIGIMIPTLFVISIITFIIIQLPPGDFLSSYASSLRAQGEVIDEDELEVMRERYGLNQPVYVQYGKWVWGIVSRGDWGQSMSLQKPVKELIWQRMTLSMVLSVVSLLVGWFIAIPLGVYSATHQYSLLDYIVAFISFMGIGTPSFLLGLVVMFVAMNYMGLNVGGLFSDEYILAPWSLAKVIDLLKHIWMPVAILAFNGTAGGLRTTRANLLDELNKPYVETARSKGLKEGYVIWKYPVRVALNPFFSTVGWELANLISGATLLSI
ncbi:MAG TPA: ABC transporter permease, partial [Anaerolineales bacterium]|nr:ABC transporter permease [Anaerolineales bacterium]